MCSPPRVQTGHHCFIQRSHYSLLQLCTSFTAPSSPAFLKPTNSSGRNTSSAANQSSLWGPSWKTAQDKKVLLPLDWWWSLNGSSKKTQMRLLAKWFSLFLFNIYLNIKIICLYIHVNIYIYSIEVHIYFPPTVWFWKRTRQTLTILWSITEGIHGRRKTIIEQKIQEKKNLTNLFTSDPSTSIRSLHKIFKTRKVLSCYTLTSSSLPISRSQKEQQNSSCMGAIRPTQTVSRGASEPSLWYLDSARSITLWFWQTTKYFIGKYRKARQEVNQLPWVFPTKSSRSMAALLASDTSLSVSRSSWFFGLGVRWGIVCLFVVGFLFFF